MSLYHPGTSQVLTSDLSDQAGGQGRLPWGQWPGDTTEPLPEWPPGREGLPPAVRSSKAALVLTSPSREGKRVISIIHAGSW